MNFIVIFAIIPSKIDDVKFDRKYKRRKNLLEDEARRIILNKLDSPMYRKINSNQCFKQWFLDGYVNGVDDGGERKVYKPYSTEYEIISIEEYVKRRGFDSSKSLSINLICSNTSSFKSCNLLT